MTALLVATHAALVGRDEVSTREAAQLAGCSMEAMIGPRALRLATPGGRVSPPFGRCSASALREISADAREAIRIATGAP